MIQAKSQFAAAAMKFVAAGLLCAQSVALLAQAQSVPASAPAPPTPDAPPQQKLARIWANEPALVGLARDHFGAGKFTEVDAKFFAAVAANEWADFRPSPDKKYDVADITSWEGSPKLPADRIIWLCTDQAASRLVPSHGIWLKGVEIEGRINLYRYSVPFSLTFYDCLLNDGMYIANAKLQELDIRNSCSAAIAAREMSASENVYLIGTAVFGGANFTGAQIAGDFNFSGGLAFHGRTAEDLEKSGFALELYDAKVGGDVLLNENFRAFGQVRMIGAQIGRSLTCNGSRFVSVKQMAIDARACHIAGNAKFSENFRAEGGVNVSRMHVGGDLDCEGGRFIASGTDALSADLVNVDGQVLLGDGFYAEGEVRMINATIGGNVDCDSGTFHHPDGDALSLDGASIGRGLHIGTDAGTEPREGEEGPPHFIARGTVRLLGTKIETDIYSDGGEFDTPGGTAILASNVRIGSRAVLMNMKAAGTVDFSSAQIEHEFDLRGAQIDGRQAPSTRALVCNGMTIRGHLYCNFGYQNQQARPFRIDGQMLMQFATVGMYWDLTGAELSNPGNIALEASDARIGGYINLDGVAIDGEANFSRAKIEGVWVIRRVQHPERMTLDLRFAHIWVIKDERLEDWPPAGHLKLEGLVYDHFDDDSPLDVEDRLAWLARQYATRTGGARPLSRADDSLFRPTVIPATFQESDSVAAVGTVGEREVVVSVTEDDATAESDAATDAAVKVIEDTLKAGHERRQRMMVAPDDSAAIEEAASPPNVFEPKAVTPAEAEAETDPSSRRYVTQPYTQLASVYRAIGQDEQANRVLVARAERLGELSPAFSAHGIWYRYVGQLIGYGYEPFRAVKIGVVIVILGGLVFGIGNRRHLMAETKLAEHVLSQEGEPRLISPNYPTFNPFVYSLDVFLPFVDLQQICYWLPGENGSGPKTSRNCLLHFGPWSLKWSAVLRLYLWFQTLAGWTLCTLLAAAVTGIVKS